MISTDLNSMFPCMRSNFKQGGVVVMYMKEPEKCYRYNDAEDADFTKIVDPKHTALLMIDMQNVLFPKRKICTAGRAADSIN